MPWNLQMLFCFQYVTSFSHTNNTTTSTHSLAWSNYNHVTTATKDCHTLFTVGLCNLWRCGTVGSIQCACRWSEKVNYCWFCGVDKRVSAMDLVSPCLWEIIIVPGNAGWCTKTGAEQMWGLIRNFICYRTLQQISLLIRSPWIRLGIWTVCSWMDWLMSFCALIATHTHAHTPPPLYFQLV